MIVRRPGRRAHLLLIWLAVAPIGLLGCGVRWPRDVPKPIRYVEEPGRIRHPAAADSTYGAGVKVLRRSLPYTASVLVFPTGQGDVVLESARPVDVVGDLVVVGTAVGGTDRGLGQAIGSHGFPPADLPPDAATEYRPLEGFIIRDDAEGRERGADVLIGVRLRSGALGTFKGIEVTYSVGPQRYIATFRVAFALCTEAPCDGPDLDPPWGEP